jgi:hypothetical protein
MHCTIFARAVAHIEQAAHLAVDEFWRKLRSPLTVVMKAFLWVTLVLIAIIAISFFLVSQVALGFVALFQKLEPEQAQPTLELLPLSRQKQYPQCDLAQPPAQQKRLLIPMSEVQVVKAIEKRLYYQQEAQTLRQWVIAQLPLPIPSSSTLHSGKPLNNALALHMISWEAFAKVTQALKSIKASELKEVASSLKIKNYRRMNKSELLVAIATIT